jgi:hypothetical protein
MILQSDNGQEFLSQIIVELMNLWKDVIIVHGHARHPQSQGSVEHANQDVEVMLGNWLREQYSKKLVLNCHLFQMSNKNTSDHLGVGSNPYPL